MTSRVEKAKARRIAIFETRAELARRFPLCFMPKGSEKKPLEVNIDIPLREQCPDLSKNLIDAAIQDYVRGAKYLRNMVEGATRVDLDGSPAGEVTEAAADRAAEVLAAVKIYNATRFTDENALATLRLVLWRKPQPMREAAE